jgi:Na+/H+ antiporter NhaD/arsenite permease-like protein
MDAHLLLAAEGPPPLAWAAPFALLLACVAVLPLVRRTEHWWHSNRNKLMVSAALGLVTLAYYFAARGFHVSEPGWASVLSVLDHALVREYVPFMVMLLALYTVAGGIELTGDLPGRPAVNTAFLAAGTLIASFVGTTGAAMLLVRPLLKANAGRRHVVHTVVFFIFAVCNCGGLLLPIGDPPLFIGYLRGVPFTWTLGLWPEWLVVNGIVLAVYVVWERRAFRRETVAPPAAEPRRRLGFTGGRNFVLLAIVIASVAFLVPGRPLGGTSWTVPAHLREVVMLACAGASLRLRSFTPAGLRERVGFDFFPIAEVGAIFLGLFITMQVPLEILDDPRTVEALGIRTPAAFFWATGGLSAVLDNAPTYIVFLEAAKSVPQDGAFVTLVSGMHETGHVSAASLAAISCGAVFMGALTYIGNGPNFLVRAIAEQAGVPMPTFFGYLRYSLAVLLPILVIVSFVFFG